MKPILRFLQLLCENHNAEFQVELLFPLDLHLNCSFRIIFDYKITRKRITILFVKH